MLLLSNPGYIYFCRRVLRLQKMTTLTNKLTSTRMNTEPFILRLLPSPSISVFLFGPHWFSTLHAL